MLRKLLTPKASGPRPGTRGVSQVVALTLVAATGVACGGSSGTPRAAEKAGGELVWGKAAEADLLDPAISGTAVAWELQHLTYERLVSLDGNLKPVPELAESWERTSPTTYEFRLRTGVKFSNGREMTAEDVAGSLKRVMDPKLAAFWAGQLGIEDVEASGPARVTITLAKPRTAFVAALGGSPAAILPIRELEAKTFDPKKELLGTGPFKVVSHSQNESWVFDRNPHYWRPGLPKVEKLTVRIMPEDATRVAALRDGGIDVTTFETPDTIRLLKGQPGVATTVQATTDFYRLDVNAKSSPFTDDRLRQALSLSIDREKLRNVALGGVGRPTAAVPAAFGGACDPAAVPFATPDVRRARALVEAAGATGETVEIMTIPAVPMSPAIAQLLQRNLQAAGLKPRIVSYDLGEVVKRGRTGEFDIRVAWSAGYADPAMVTPLWNPELASYNKAWAKPDTELNKLIDTSIGAAPGPGRDQVLRDFCGRVAQNSNMIPVLSKDAIVAYRTDKVSPLIPRVEGYALPLRQIARFATM
jgi:peptide/nickel transport system substrate-binding protein